jgi:hypothetical protein
MRVRLEQVDCAFNLDSDPEARSYTMRIALGGGDEITLGVSTDGMIGLLMEMERCGLVDYVREMRAAERDWQRMGPLERAEALGEGDPHESGYALDDPKHETFRERMADAADAMRKRGKGE